VTVDVARRLPGLKFEAIPPPSPRVLPRMDVAAFVGFATGGPFDLPVAIEDGHDFAATFGEDLPLAIDPVSGDTVTTQLGSAVRTFLRNGGQRCWVVRVGATHGETTRFLIPGLLGVAAGKMTPVALSARSPGSWADQVSVATALESAPAEIVASAGDVFELRFPSTQTIQPGDLVRLSGDGWSVMAPAIAPPPESPPTTGSPPAPGSPPTTGGSPSARIAFDRARALWVEPVGAESLPHPPLDLGASPPFYTPATAAFTAADGAWLTGVRATVGELDEHARLTVELGVAPEQAPVPGTLVQLTRLGGRDLWLAIDSIRAAEDQVLSPPGPESCGVTGAAWWISTQLPAGPLPARNAEKLTLELWATRPGQPTAVVGGVAFAPESGRWIGALPSDEQVHGDDSAGSAVTFSDAIAAGLPLYGAGADAHAILFPLGIGVVPSVFLDAARPAQDAAARNGITGDSVEAFLDPGLVDLSIRALGEAADFIRYQAPVPRRLRGLHAVMELDEVTLLALPDATQPRWDTVPRPPLPEVTAPTAVCHPDPAGFGRCGFGELQAPQLHATEADDAGRATLSWSPTDAAGTDYLVEASADPAAFGDPVTLYDGPDTSLVIDALQSGPFYRVRAQGPMGDSDWSNGVGVDAGPPSENYVSPDYDSGPLRAIQRAALRMCAARGDILTVLSLPSGYREDQAIAHVTALRSAEADEPTALTHGAVYHPWLTIQLGAGSPPFRISPDGPVTGSLAERAIERGAWVAAANEPFNDVVGLGPTMSRGRLADLQVGRVNVIRHEPAGFVYLDEDTLSLGEDLQPINVRRLIDLLRRLVLMYAPAYVFEPNDARLRRRIQRGFEANLRTMYSLGAFRGAVPEQAFQVVSGDPPNTRQSTDQGRLVVELRVAPSLPMRFMTVRLVQGAAGGLETQEA
jgi:hypothetical protein